MKKHLAIVILLCATSALFAEETKYFKKSFAGLLKAESQYNDSKYSEAVKTLTPLIDGGIINELADEMTRIDKEFSASTTDSGTKDLAVAMMTVPMGDAALTITQLALKIRGQSYYHLAIKGKEGYDIDKGLANKALADFNKADEIKTEKSDDSEEMEVMIAYMKKDIDWRFENQKPAYKKIRAAEKKENDKKYSDAIALFTESIKLDPGITFAYTGRARCYIESGNDDMALQDYTKAVELNLKNNAPDEYVYLERGKLYFKKEMYAQALDDFKKSPSGNGWTYYGMALCYERLKNIPDAITNYEIVIRDYSMDSYAHYYLYKIYYDREDYANAIRVCDAKLKTSKDSDMLINRGKANLFGLKDYKAAIADFTRSIEYYPCEQNYYYRGLAYAYMNDWDSAVKDWNNENCKYNFTRIFHGKSDINATDENGATVAMWVVYDQKLELLQLLYDRGAKVKKKGIIWIDKQNGSYFGGILHIAAGLDSYSDDNKLAIVKFLVEECDIDVDDGELDYKTGKEISYTPLFEACYNGDAKVFNYLVSKGADINAEYNGMTPMSMLLSGHIDSEIFNYLKIKNAKVNYKDPALFLNAASYGSLEAVSCFIEKGVEINSNLNGKNALHYAAKNGDIKMVELLLKNRIDVNFNQDGLTALQYAVNSNNRDIVELLLKNGADFTIPFIKRDKDKKETERWTPLQLAQKKKYPEIIAVLKKYGAKK